MTLSFLPYRSDVERQYLESPKICLACGDWLPYQKRWGFFCSRSCAVARNNTISPKRKRKVRICPCGASIQKRNKYCDICILTHAYGRAEALDDCHLDSTRRRFLIRTRGRRCESCGRRTWAGHPIPLELDHSDGNPDPNMDSNLKLRCPNCHAVAPHYRGAKKKGGVLCNSARNRQRRARYRPLPLKHCGDAPVS